MKRTIQFFAALAWLSAFSVMAYGDALDALPLNGNLTQLEDDDFEILVNSDGTLSDPGADKNLDVGDFFVGSFRISNIQQPPTTVVHDFNENGGETFTAIFALKIATNPSPGDVTFEALTDAEWDAIGLNDLGYTRNSSNTAAIVFDDPDNIANTDDGNPVNDFTEVGGTPLWEFGFGNDSFWVVNGDTNNIALAAGTVGAFATFNAGLDVTFTYPTASGITLDPILNSVLGLGFPPGDNQLLINGVSLGPGQTDFDLLSDTDLFVQASRAVPEPGSVVLFVLGFVGLGGGAWLRNRRAKLAA